MTKSLARFSYVQGEFAPPTAPYLSPMEMLELTFEHIMLDDEVLNGYNLLLIHPKHGTPILARTIDCEFIEEDVVEKYDKEFYEKMIDFFREDNLFDNLDGCYRQEFTLAMAENDAMHDIINNLYGII